MAGRKGFVRSELASRPITVYFPYNVELQRETALGRLGLGGFEASVLLAVHRLHGQGYAVSIGDDLKERMARSVSLGAIYATLERLEKKGMVKSRLGDPTPERGGRPKRMYRIEGTGLHALAETQEREAAKWADVPPFGAPG